MSILASVFTSACNGPISLTDTNDIIDAEFVTIASGSDTKAQHGRPPFEAKAKAKADDDNAQLGLFRDSAAGGASLREELLGGQRMSLPVFTIVAIVLSVAAFLAAGGYTLLLPASPAVQAEDAAPAAPLEAEPDHRSLEIEGLQLSHSSRGGHFILTVRARIHNNSATDLVVPPLLITFPDGARGKRYFIPRGESLRSGEQMAFTSHLRVDEIPATDPVISFEK